MIRAPHTLLSHNMVFDSLIEAPDTPPDSFPLSPPAT
jgi:hypothetical protein